MSSPCSTGSRHPKVAIVALFAATVVACSSDESTDALPLSDAERARELSFIAPPRVERRSRSEFQGSAESLGQRLTDAEIDEYHAVWGRLGFFPRTFDIRSAFGAGAQRVGAFYDPTEKSITLFEDPHRDTIVHELVHALQDQHFDLLSFDATAKSSDEVLALRAVVEGDAHVCEGRYHHATAGDDPLAILPRQVGVEGARELSEYFLQSAPLPRFFSAYASFTYPFGGAMVARALGLLDGAPRWSRSGADALFSGDVPRTSEEVIRRGLGVESDPVVEVGLTRIPEPLAAELEVDGVDRLGSWYARLLLARDGELLPPAGATVPNIETAWDGDQLVSLRARDVHIPRAETAAVAVVWTTAWDDDAVATGIAADLERLHSLDASEPVVIDRRANVVVLARGALDVEKLRVLASAALHDRDDAPRLSIRRRWAGAERFGR